MLEYIFFGGIVAIVCDFVFKFAIGRITLGTATQRAHILIRFLARICCSLGSNKGVGFTNRHEFYKGLHACRSTIQRVQKWLKSSRVRSGIKSISFTRTLRCMCCETKT